MIMINKKKLLPGFEPGIEESKSSVLTTTLQEHKKKDAPRRA